MNDIAFINSNIHDMTKQQFNSKDGTDAKKRLVFKTRKTFS